LKFSIGSTALFAKRLLAARSGRSRVTACAPRWLKKIDSEFGTKFVTVSYARLIRLEHHRRQRPAQLGAGETQREPRRQLRRRPPNGRVLLRRDGIDEHAKVKERAV